MVCIYCQKKTYVINSRLQKRSNRIWRRRKCTECGTVFSSLETPRYDTTWLVENHSGSISPFSPEKLLLSIYRSCQHRSDALEVTIYIRDSLLERLRKNFSDGIATTKEISSVAEVALLRFDKAAGVHYHAYHRRIKAV